MAKSAENRHGYFIDWVSDENESYNTLSEYNELSGFGCNRSESDELTVPQPEISPLFDALYAI